jgi:putative membrane protein
MMGWYGNGGHMLWFGPVMMAISVALICAGIVVVTYLLVRDRRSSAAPPGLGSLQGPLQVLDMRFARGELDDEEYQRRRTMLMGGRSS